MSSPREAARRVGVFIVKVWRAGFYDLVNIAYRDHTVRCPHVLNNCGCIFLERYLNFIRLDCVAFPMFVSATGLNLLGSRVVI